MKKLAFITEPRKYKALKYVLENFLTILPKEWSIQVNHGTYNENYIRNIIHESEIISKSNQNGRLSLYNLGVKYMTHEDESNLLRTKEFWDNFRILLRNAIKLKIYKRVNYNEKPVKYCGVEKLRSIK